MIDAVTMNARKPEETANGTAMLNRMNTHHGSLYAWGLSHVELGTQRQILDIGFGGGQNIKNLGEALPDAHIEGLDHSTASCKACAALNAAEVEKGRVSLSVGSAEALPYEEGRFDLVTAFETVYYWPHIGDCFAGVCRVLRPGGRFLVCNEDSLLAGHEEAAAALDMVFYTAADLEALLHRAGFSSVTVDTHENDRWVCAVAVR